MQPVLRQAQEQTGDLLYSLTVIQKMEYHAAWELATREWAFLPGEDRPERPSLISIVRQADPEPDPVPSRDFRITEAHRIGEGGLSEKARDNIEAIRTLRLVEDESRDARPTPRKPCSPATAAGARWRMSSIPIRRSDWQEIARERQRTADARGIRLGARLDAERAFHIADGDPGAVAGDASASGSQPARSILEPSMGVGHFFGLMPEALLPGCRRTGVELDGITARIAKAALSRTRRYSRRGSKRRPCRIISSTR